MNNQLAKEVSSLINDKTEDEVRSISKPSTSATNVDIMEYVNSITSDVDFEEEERKMKEFEVQFLRMIKSESNVPKTNPPVSVNISFPENIFEREDDEIDVVNGSPEELHFPPESNIETIENPEQQKSTETNDSSISEIVEEEIDVVNVPVNESNTNVLLESTLENINNTETIQKTPKTRKHSTNQEHLDSMTSVNIRIETESIAEEIDVVNLPSEMSASVSESRTPKRKIRRSARNMPTSNEDEIIDVENITEDASLSSALVNANRNLDIRKKRKTRTSVIDLVNTTFRENSIIEIIDSPAAPTIISGVIEVDDDDQNVSDSRPTKTSKFGTCPVCLEDLSKCEIMSTMCGHVFCAVCIKTVIKTHKKCPKCRKHLTLKSIHPLFF